MSAEPKPTDLINRFYEEMGRDNFDYAFEAADPEYKSHTEKSEVDPKTLKESCEAVAMPGSDVVREVLFEFNDGDVGCVVHRYRATDRETGDVLSIRSADIYRVRNGKLLEHWGMLQEDE